MGSTTAFIDDPLLLLLFSSSDTFTMCMESITAFIDDPLLLFSSSDTFIVCMGSTTAFVDDPLLLFSSSDTFTVCMESITAFVDGPLALLAFVAFIKNKPYRYLIQLIVSLCQLYGDVLYFMTEIKVTASFPIPFLGG